MYSVRATRYAPPATFHLVCATWYVPLGTRHPATWYDVYIVCHQLPMLKGVCAAWRTPPGTRHRIRATQHDVDVDVNVNGEVSARATRYANQYVAPGARHLARATPVRC